MKIVRKNDAVAFENGPDCQGVEYNFSDESTMNGAHIAINGRYPRMGEALNEVCDEVAYILEGSGDLIQNGLNTEFKAGDCVYLGKGERYAWEGTFKMLVVCTPAFYPEQHKEVE